MIPAVALLAVALLWSSEDAGSAAPDAGTEPATEPAPGEPRPDPALDGGVLVVELADARGAPLPGATLFVEAMDASGERKRLETETDAGGRVRVEDLPHGGPHRLMVGYLGDGGLLTSSRPFQLGPDQGAHLRLVVPEQTPDPQGVVIEQLHVVLDREGARLRVTETLRLASRDGTVFTNPQGLLLPLPQGASGPRLANAEKSRDQARVTGAGFVITAPIPPAGIELTLVFQLPIDSGRVRFEQAFPLPVSTARVISTWTVGRTSLRAEGFGAAEPAQLQNGLTALVTMGRGLAGDRLAVTLAGIEDGPARTRRILAFAVSVLLLVVGLALWIRRRARAAGSGEDDPA